MDRVGNRDAIVVAVSKRARQLKEGAKPFVEIGSHNPTTIALHEIAAGYVQILDAAPEKEEEPEEPEVVEVTGDAERLSAVIQSLEEESQEGEEASEEAEEAEAEEAESEKQEKTEADE